MSTAPPTAFVCLRSSLLRDGRFGRPIWGRIRRTAKANGKDKADEDTKETEKQMNSIAATIANDADEIAVAQT